MVANILSEIYKHLIKPKIKLRQYLSYYILMAQIIVKSFVDLPKSLCNYVSAIDFEIPIITTKDQINQVEKFIFDLALPECPNINRIEILTYIGIDDHQLNSHASKITQKISRSLKEKSCRFSIGYTGNVLQHKTIFTLNENCKLLDLKDGNKFGICNAAGHGNRISREIDGENDFTFIEFQSTLCSVTIIRPSDYNLVVGFRVDEPEITTKKQIHDLFDKIQHWLRRFKTLQYVYLQFYVNKCARKLFDLLVEKIALTDFDIDPKKNIQFYVECKNKHDMLQDRQIAFLLTTARTEKNIVRGTLDFYKSFTGDVVNIPVECPKTMNEACELLEKDDQKPSTSSFVSENPNETVSNSLFLPPVHNFCGRADELNELMFAIYDKQFTFIVVSGSGGVGKTELSRKLIYLHDNSETVVCSWLAGDTDQTLQSSLQRLANLYNLTIYERAEEIISRVGNFITAKTQTWLLIMDNVDEMTHSVSSVVKIINRNFKHKAVVLITSRNVCILNRIVHKKVKLIELKNDEAKQLIMQSLGIKTENECVKKLCKVLQNYPLALQQAVAYIKERKKFSIIGESYGISEYLEEYIIEKQKLLDFPLCDIPCDYQFTVYTTWNITINRLKMLNPTVINIMNVVAYINPDKIQITNLEDICINMDLENLERSEIKEAMELCKKYSIVKIENSALSVHCLLQEVFKLQLCASGLEFSCLGSLINAMATTITRLPSENKKDENIIKIRIREFMFVWDFAIKKYVKIIHKVKTVPCQIASTMIKIKYTMYHNFYEASLSSLKEEYGLSDNEVCKMEIFTELSKYLKTKQKIKEWKKMFVWLEKMARLDPANDVLSTFIQDAAFDYFKLTFELTPDEEDLKTIENVAAHLSKTLGEDHSHTIKVQFLLGVSLMNNGKHLRAIPLLKKYCACTSEPFDISKYKGRNNNPSSSQIHYQQAHKNCGISLVKYYSSLTSKPNKIGGYNSFFEEDATLIDPLCSLQQIEEAVCIWEKQLQLERLPHNNFIRSKHDLFFERLKLVYTPDKIVEYTKKILKNILSPTESDSLNEEKIYYRIKLAEALELSSNLRDFNQQVMEIIEDAKNSKDMNHLIFDRILKFADGLLERNKCNEAHLIYHALLTLLDNPKGLKIRKETTVRLKKTLKSKIPSSGSVNTATLLVSNLVII